MHYLHANHQKLGCGCCCCAKRWSSKANLVTSLIMENNTASSRWSSSPSFRSSSHGYCSLLPILLAVVDHHGTTPSEVYVNYYAAEISRARRFFAGRFMSSVSSRYKQLFLSSWWPLLLDWWQGLGTGSSWSWVIQLAIELAASFNSSGLHKHLIFPEHIATLLHLQGFPLRATN